MNIKKVSIEKLRAADYNPRKDLKPEDEEYQKIKRSIEEFGYVDPVIINKDMTIIGGHQRYKVLKDLGFESIECVVVDLDKGNEKLLNIALNKISGEWDFPKMKDLLQDLDSLDMDLELTGFDFTEIEDILSGYDADELPDDIDLEKDSSDVKNINLTKMMFGKYKIQLTDEEYEKLERLYLDFSGNTKNSFGFVTYLLSKFE